MTYLGDIRLEDTIDFKFCTVTTTGAPTVLAGTPVVSAYLDNSVTQVTAGVTLTVDFDSVVGLNNVRVVASSGNGFATAQNVQLVITTGTVGGTSVVGYVVGQFSIEARSALRPVTAQRNLVVDANGLADANTVKVGPTGSGTAQTAGDIPARLPAALVSGRMDSSVGAIVNGVIVAATFAANALDAVWSTAARVLTAGTNIVLAKGVGVTGFTDLSAADVRTAVGLAAANLDTQLSAINSKTTNLPADPADASDIAASFAALNNISTAQVNAEVVDALNVDTYAEPTGVPAATATIVAKLGRLHQALRNRIDITSSKKTFYDDADAALWEKDLSDNGTTYSESEGNAP